MKRIGTILAVAMGAAVALGSMGGCERQDKTAHYDPALDGFLPHPVDNSDPTILENQRKLYDAMVAVGGGAPVAPKPVASAPAPAPGNESVPPPGGEAAGATGAPAAAPEAPPPAPAPAPAPEPSTPAPPPPVPVVAPSTPPPSRVPVRRGGDPNGNPGGRIRR